MGSVVQKTRYPAVKKLNYELVLDYCDHFIFLIYIYYKHTLLRPAIGSSDQSADRLGYPLRIDGVFNIIISIVQLPKNNCRILRFVS